ncbi:MAG: Smr/MutS family protein [Desulfobacterales bacterium]
MMKRKREGAEHARPLPLKRRLKRYPGPQHQIDLHGCRAHQAIQRTEAFVRTAFNDGVLTVRIIVGKGLHSESGPVLPEVVENCLLALKQEGILLSYRWEGRSRTRSGAIIAYLNSVGISNRGDG